ncbi:uncharacterized protein LOC129791113 [Lutzomyia longipalpis]|uniref:uncharacterized protein LOC129791113 n=1 Tax=Lutzomyia longipalpis TaxID=7200 RepID=UPI0024840A48|nr:uncharacterized protein LOC129791113 [Lutzomyia longipalpis]
MPLNGTENDEIQHVEAVNFADNQTSVCRICCKPEKWLLPIHEGHFEELPYKQIYQEVIRQPLKEYRNHPLKICETCVTDMLNSYKFRKRCLETEDKLKNLEGEREEINDPRIVIIKEEVCDAEFSVQRNDENTWKTQENGEESRLTNANNNVTETPIQEDNRNDFRIMDDNQEKDNPDQTLYNHEMLNAEGNSTESSSACRICLDHRKELFSIDEGIFEGIPYKDIYQECIGQTLKDYRNHPSKICQPCETDMLNAYKFRKRCLETNNKLKESEDEFQETNDLLVEIKHEMDTWSLQLDENETWDERDNDEDDQEITMENNENDPQQYPRNDESSSRECQEIDNESPMFDDDAEVDATNPTVEDHSTARAMVILDGACRICLKPENCLISLLDGVFEKCSYMEIYQETLGQPLKEYKSHPPWICQPCEHDMLHAYKFRKRCLETDEKIQMLEENFLLRKIREELPTTSSITKSTTSASNATESSDESEQDEDEINTTSCAEDNVTKEDEKDEEDERPHSPRVTRRKMARRHTIHDTDQSDDLHLLSLVPKIVLRKLDNTKKSKEKPGSSKKPHAKEPSNAQKYTTRGSKSSRNRDFEESDSVMSEENESQKTYKCDLCPKISTNLSNLKSHIWLAHEKSQMVKCDMCGRNVKKTFMKFHLKSHEVNELKKTSDASDESIKKPYQCSHCPKRFKTVNAISYHTVAIHEKDKKIQCRICRRFIKGRIMKYHMKTHEK